MSADGAAARVALHGSRYCAPELKPVMDWQTMCFARGSQALVCPIGSQARHTPEGALITAFLGLSLVQRRLLVPPDGSFW